jgi:pimeloyl-ACP methyl ester carboxylesterase
VARTTEATRGGRNALKLYFRSPELDFNTQVLLGYAAAGGAAVGEVLATVSAIDEKDMDSWVRAWSATADRVEAQGRESLASGHRESAREAFLRATTYHRAATFCLGVRDPRLERTVRALRGSFAAAAPLFDPPLEPVVIPFEGGSLPGYFVRPSADDVPRPTLIMIGGGELYHEELFFWTGDAGRRRGWNVLVVDLPGQGWTVYEGMRFRADVEVPFTAVVDHLLGRADVDRTRLAAYGVSLGGYMVLRAATVEHRLAAIALSTPMPDVHRWLVDALPPSVRRMPRMLADSLTRLAGGFEPQTRIAIEKWLAHVGASSFTDGVERFRSWTADPALVTCPTLCLVGEGEVETFHTQTRLAYEALTVPKELRVTTIAEGADGHCQSNNFPLSQRLVFDWLDRTLAA